MATPNINTNCSILIFKYGSGGVFQGSYLNCGDLTPIVLSATGGVSGSTYTTVYGLSASTSITTGSVQVSSQIGGYTQTYQAWTQYTTTKNP
jgi:hypothetical protein